MASSALKGANPWERLKNQLSRVARHGPGGSGSPTRLLTTVYILLGRDGVGNISQRLCHIPHAGGNEFCREVIEDQV
jgi:hypothetical protein